MTNYTAFSKKVSNQTLKHQIFQADVSNGTTAHTEDLEKKGGLTWMNKNVGLLCIKYGNNLKYLI